MDTKYLHFSYVFCVILKSLLSPITEPALEMIAGKLCYLQVSKNSVLDIFMTHDKIWKKYFIKYLHSSDIVDWHNIKLAQLVILVLKGHLPLYKVGDMTL